MQRHKPKLGQNFLVDDAARHRIADALGDISARTVIEIGPGHGAITTILAERAQRLVCIELDRALAAELRFRFRNHANVAIVEADVLQTPLGPLAGQGSKASIIGNLPYYITSDILLHLLESSQAIDQAVIMMQREVAERVAAEPGTRDFGLLSATAQMYAQVDHLFDLPPDAFKPPPDVYSSVLQLRFQPRFDEFGISDRNAFDLFLKQSFQQKRKTLHNNLRVAGYTSERIGVALTRADVSFGVRAEALPLSSLASIHRTLADHSAE